MSLYNHIKSLRRGVTPYGKAPHKPILLLSVIEGFEKGYLSSEKVPIIPELITSFHDIWKSLVKTNHTLNFSLPFFHLASESSGIWKLKTLPGQKISRTKSSSIKSLKSLKETVQFAHISQELFQALN